MGGFWTSAMAIGSVLFGDLDHCVLCHLERCSPKQISCCLYFFVSLFLLAGFVHHWIHPSWKYQWSQVLVEV